MSDRYGYCEDGHTAWCVYDTHDDRRRIVSRHHMEQDARAEAARLNAEAPKRAAPVTAWALIMLDGSISPWWIWTDDQKPKGLPVSGERIARVRIEEIEE